MVVLTAPELPGQTYYYFRQGSSMSITSIYKNKQQRRGSRQPAVPEAVRRVFCCRRREAIHAKAPDEPDWSLCNKLRSSTLRVEQIASSLRSSQ